MVVLLVVVFVIRPIGVFLSTHGSDLKMNERVFISWVGPRGIVAAGIASLFGSKLLLKEEPVPDAEFITPLVFMIVLGTVLLNATTARIFAKVIGVFLKKSDGILIVGASEVSRLIAKYLQKNDRHVILLDSNSTNVRMAKELDLDAIEANIYSDDVTDNVELSHVGYLMALTGSSDINTYAINRFRKQFGENGAFRLISKGEMDDPTSIPKEGLFSATDDYINLVEVARKYPIIQEIPVNSEEEFTSVTDTLLKEKEMIPLFLKQKDGYIGIISSFIEETELSSYEGSNVVYLGKPIINELEGITKDSL